MQTEVGLSGGLQLKQHNGGYAVCNLRGACRESLAARRGARTTSVALVGEKKNVFELTTTLYVLYASCTTCVIDPRFPEPKCGGPRGLRGPSPESGTQRSKVR